MATLEELKAARAESEQETQAVGQAEGVVERLRAARDQSAISPNPDGTFGQPPEGVSFDPATGQMIDEPQRQAIETRRQENLVQSFPVAGRAQEVLQGIPFVGEFTDEALGMINPEAGERARRVSDAFEAQRPGQSTALNIGGSILATLPAFAAGAGTRVADFIGRGTTGLARATRAGAAAAPAGAVEGALSFAGRADPGQRLEAAGTGALVGGSLGAALGPLAQSLGETAVSAVKRIKKLDARAIADEFGVSLPAARAMRAALANDDLDTAVARLSDLGDDALLADAGPSTSALLNASMSTGGGALSVAREAVEGRSKKAGQQLGRVLDGVLGKPKGLKKAAEGISRKTSAARREAYAAAYGSPIDYAGSAGQKIDDVLARVPPGTMRKAVEEANEAMQEASTRNKQMLVSVGDDGSVSLSELPNVQQLDFLKRALDDISRGSVDQFGRLTSAGVRADRLATDLRDAVKDAVPSYGAALKVGGDKIQTDKGLDLGRRILNRNTTVEDVQRFLRGGVSKETKASMRQGMRESIEQGLSNVRRTITDPNTDAREAMQLVKDMSSRANVDKVRLILGDVRADRLMKELDRSATALELRSAVARNSDTAIRQSIQGQVAEEAAPSLARRVAGEAGGVLDASREITRALAATDKGSISQTQKRLFDEIAGALVGIKGKNAERALGAVNRAISGQPLKDAEAELIGRVVGGAIAAGTYRPVSQSIGTRMQPQGIPQ